MKYINLSTLEYPVYEGQLRLLFPEIPEEVTFPDFPVPEGFAQVFEKDPPDFDCMTQKRIIHPPQLIDGVWYETYTVEALSEQEINKILEDNEKRLMEERLKNSPPPLDNEGAPPNVLA